MGIFSHKKYNYFTGGKHHASKYNNNPILKWINNGFMDSLSMFVQKSGAKSIFEIGCGEGQLIGILKEQGYDVKGCDFDQESVDITNENFLKYGLGQEVATLGNLYDINAYDERIVGRMLICCEVLEHVPNPEEGLKIIASCTNDYFIVSVPREPLWCILNMARGKYLSSFGNTPGHINHWTKREFVKMVSKYADVVEVCSPIPWTMVLAKKKNGE